MTRPTITGLGAACPLGVGARTVWQRLLASEPALCERPPTAAGLDTRPATAFAEPFPAERYADRRTVRKASDLARLAAAASVGCVADAALPEDPELRDRMSVVLGTCFGGSGYYLDFHERVRRRGPRAANAVLFTEGVFNAAPGHASALLGFRGPGLAVVGGEEAGLSALLTATDRLLLGAAPGVLAGGADCFCDRVQASLLSEGRIGARLGGPFAPEVGPWAEGGAALFLEPRAAAEARGAHLYAEILGGVRGRAANDTDPEGLVRCAERALELAGRAPADVDLVVGGACGGPPAQREREALAQLGLRGWVCWPQALLGEGFAFGSALQALVAALALAEDVVPPTYAPDGQPPRAGELRGVSAPHERAHLRTALVLSSSRPGGCVALVLGRA
ncbi:MAG: hypothetical protein D6731_16145 [Planctomycetota bacterium]|nr:MAG: hypothetical protein D6731_16145 [Planctomycetota bacterium]